MKQTNLYITKLSVLTIMICTCWLTISSFYQANTATIANQIATPVEFERQSIPSNTFGFYLRHLPLKPKETPVLLYNGSEKINQRAHERVIDISVGTKDLQQCADAVIRLRAEYLFKTNQKDKISFNFTSGHACKYSAWAAGYRPKINGNKVSFQKVAQADDSYQNFQKYLTTVFTYAGSYSLSRELKKVAIENMEIGDVFIKGGFPGHAAIVVDVAISNTGKKVFLLAQSYMPAQNIHILKNPTSNNLTPWYEIPQGDFLITPEWTFGRNELMRF